MSQNGRYALPYRKYVSSKKAFKFKLIVFVLNVNNHLEGAYLLLPALSWLHCHFIFYITNVIKLFLRCNDVTFKINWFKIFYKDILLYMNYTTRKSMKYFEHIHTSVFSCRLLFSTKHWCLKILLGKKQKPKTKMMLCWCFFVVCLF